MSDKWVETTLGDVCSFISEKVDPATLPGETQYVGLEHITPRQPLLSLHGCASDVTSLVAAYTAGDTLFGRLRPYLHKVAIASEPGVCSPEILVLRARRELVEPGFLYLLASSEDAISHAVALSAGSRMPRTSVNDLSSFEIRLPPLLVQRRIVDLLAHLDNHLANLQTEREAAERLLETSARNPMEIGSWPSLKLKDVAAMYQPKTLAKSSLDQGGTFVVYGANGPIGHHSEYNHEESEVAVTCRGATCGVVNWTPPQCWINGNAMVVQPLDERVSRRYLFWALQFLTDVSQSISGSAQPQITRTSLSPIRVPVPSINEQSEYVETLDAVAQLTQALDSERRRLSGLRSRLLSSCLSGAMDLGIEYDSLLSEAA